MTSKPERYLAFYSDHYQPRGGWNDLVGTFDHPVEALRAIKARYPFGSRWEDDHWEIVDTETGQVREGRCRKTNLPNDGLRDNLTWETIDA